MSEENCTHECGSCSEDCASREEGFDFRVAPHPLSSVGKVIGVVSGKGGVGKSLVTSLLAVLMQRRGHQTAILDADITGPSIPKAFGITATATSNEQGITPVTSRGGTDIMSVNLILQDPTMPVIWRGPAIADVVKQFWSSVIWSCEEYMFVDMPPGTGDVPLTVFQSLPLDGIIIVSSPQDLVSMIVEKAVKMAEEMDVPILGVIENMSYVKCPDCGKEIKLFGDSKIEEVAARHDMKVLGRLPIDPEIAAMCDAGDIEKFNKDWMDAALEMIEGMENKVKKLRIAVTADEDHTVFQHFGHTRYFETFDVEGGKIQAHSTIDAEDSGHEALGAFLKEHGVDLLICGGIGGGAKQVLAEAGIDLVSGVSGNIEDAVKGYLAGEIKDDPSAECTHHEHGERHGEEMGGTCRGCHGSGHSCH
ncbi:MAG: P-loop NTPase [Synergistaceae bacterium]|nr:P-loop NTPase [Synergistaceae bacterium]